MYVVFMFVEDVGLWVIVWVIVVGVEGIGYEVNGLGVVYVYWVRGVDGFKVMLEGDGCRLYFWEGKLFFVCGYFVYGEE